MSKRPIRIKRTVRPGLRRRIIIPQSEQRPFNIPGTDVIRHELVREDPWWFLGRRRGIRRPRIGEDPLEARAAQNVRGTLPERIMYQNLLHFRLLINVDFTFQSSMEGGRSELGGLVADFIISAKFLVIRIQGPTHEEPLRAAKDSEQKQMLEEWGFRVIDITDLQVYDRQYLEDWTRKMLGYGPFGGGMVDAIVSNTAGVDISQELAAFLPDVRMISDKVNTLLAVILEGR